jgi:regulator of sigma E protease
VLTSIISIIIGLLVLSVLVLVHELGHFVTAKLSGVKVEEFGFGYPPRLLSFKKGETIYSINAIPFGGFTRMVGEVDPKEPRSLASKSVGTRLLVLSAGSLANLILPLILLAVSLMVPHQVAQGQVIVEQVAPNSPAAQAGLVPGDAIVSINGKPITGLYDLNRYIQLNLGKEISISFKHGDVITEGQVVPRWRPPAGQGATGIQIKLENPVIVTQSEPIWRAVPLGIKQFAETVILYKNGIISTVIGATPFTATGPVGIVEATGEVARAGISPLLEFAAVISLVLGIGNLFPLPAIDGGRIVFVLIEWVRRGKRISPQVEATVHTIGFVLLLLVMVAITYQDIIRIIQGDSLIP